MIFPINFCVLASMYLLAAPGMSRPEDFKPVPICRALESVEPGDQIPVVLSGIYAVNYLYDPDEPVCRLDVQRSTCVEFSPSLDIPPEFEALHKETLRVYVTFRGILHGPQVIPEAKIPSLPMAARLAAANRGRFCARYFRTKLVTESILSFAPVPNEVPWHSSAYKKEGSEDPSFPIGMVLPKYPPAAQALDVQGMVIVAVTVSAGEVTLAAVQFGDPVLVEEALANVRTWRFSPEVNTSFSVKYDFRLEKRPTNQDKNPVLEMRLPFYVKVTGPSNDW